MNQIIRQESRHGRKVRVIPAKHEITLRRKRVAAYCRVSTDKEKQEHSLDAQITYYNQLAEKHLEWDFLQVFYDIGSGSRITDRKGLQDLLVLCEHRQLDLILTKSISRLGRNAVDTLEIIRQLKANNIAIYFENENINTLTEEGEVLVSVMMAYAQAEGGNISENQKWSIKKQAQNNPYAKIYSRPCYGYRKIVQDKRNTLIIEPEEAVVVRKIFAWYNGGYSMNYIIDSLGRENIPSPTGKFYWSKRTIETMLSNEKYAGASIVLKTVGGDYPSRKRYANRGNSPLTLSVEHHSPIVSVETFVEAQLRRLDRASKNVTVDGQVSYRHQKYSMKRVQQDGPKVQQSAPAQYILTDELLKNAIRRIDEGLARYSWAMQAKGMIQYLLQKREEDRAVHDNDVGAQ